MNWDDLPDALNRTMQSIGGEITSPWFYMQFGIILVAAGISLAVGSALRGRFDVTSLSMGWPAPLRLFARTLMQRAGTIVFALLAEIARLVLVQSGLLYRGYVLSTAVNLATAWLIIRLATSLIRNEFVVRVVSIAAWTVAALSIIGKLGDVTAALDSISITMGALRLTPLLLIKAVVLLSIAMWLVGAAGNFIEVRISRSRDLTPSVQVLLIKLVRVALIVAAIAMVLSAVGIDLSAFAQFSGAIGVGLGVSSGKISSMNTRYISVAAGDGREILIPNEDLVTQRVINWTYTDKSMLVKVIFATNYAAAPTLVCKLAIDIASETPIVATFMAPNCLLTEFAE